MKLALKIAAYLLITIAVISLIQVLKIFILDWETPTAFGIGYLVGKTLAIAVPGILGIFILTRLQRHKKLSSSN